MAWDLSFPSLLLVARFLYSQPEHRYHLLSNHLPRTFRTSKRLVTTLSLVIGLNTSISQISDAVPHSSIASY
eukprot:scaffold5541_cov63-Cylindrotheca_fusiformis.AAC.3